MGEYSINELMAVLLARDLADGEVGYVGASAAIPLMACLLAQKSHAANLSISGLLVNPSPEAFYPSAFDFRYFSRAEAWRDLSDIFQESEKGVDFMFYSGIQIDRFGNVNLNRIGPFRGPGVGNSALGLTCKRYYIYHTSHRPDVFVEKADFISVAGTRLQGRRRAELGLPGGGPRLVVTSLAVMDFAQADGAMRLKTVHPGVTVEEVLSNTGFPLAVSDSVSVTPGPDETELALLRTIDRDGILRD